MAPLATGLYFEGPRWHKDRLWFVDAPARKVFAMTEQGDIETICTMADDLPCGLGFLPNGDLIIVGMMQRKLWRCANGRLEVYADLTSVAKGTIDDMVIDGEGHAYVGDLGANLFAGEIKEKEAIGRLICVTPEGGAHIVAEGLRFPNGIAVSGRNLVVAESDGDTLAHYAVASDSSLKFVSRLGTFGEPDGICMDAEGCVWVALFKEDAFVRVGLDGRRRETVKSLGGRGIACVIGGQNRRTLYCLSAETTHEDLMRGKTRARIDAHHVNVPGAGFP